jgi:UvrD-like helicase family protein
MEFRIADTFTASLTRLTGAEQKAVKTTAFDLQLDASAPGLWFHRLDRAPDPNFWSVRVNADVLLANGVPTEWLASVREATGDSLFDITDHLPQEAAEALLNPATGGTPAIPTPAPATADPFSHPDAQRRFRVLTNVEELERALDFPWERWAVFLHPAQRQLVERSYTGPARVSGSAGTGKTIVALHRAVVLARRHPESRVLLTTFSKALANALKNRLHYLVGNEPDIAGRIEVHPVAGIAYEMYSAAFGQPNIASSALGRPKRMAIDSPSASCSASGAMSSMPGN